MKLAGTELFSFGFDLEVVLSMPFRIPPPLGFLREPLLCRHIFLYPRERWERISAWGCEGVVGVS